MGRRVQPDLAAVLFDTMMRVRVAVLLPPEVVAAELGPWRPRVGGREFFATDAVVFDEQALDITDEVRLAERAYEAPPVLDPE